MVRILTPPRCIGSQDDLNKCLETSRSFVAEIVIQFELQIISILCIASNGGGVHD
jgi:hypothetical protein